MRLLLDTSYLHALTEAPGKFLESERRVLTARDTRCVSAVSIWEMRLKHNARYPSGARKSRFRPEDVIVALEDQDVTFLPMTVLHAARELQPPLDHKDPFDELLLVQAQEEDLLLLTVDRLLAGHPFAVSSHALG